MKTIILPENKLNELAQQVSAKMFAQHTFDNDLIRGDELKQFAPHKQINKFLIFQVYQVWEMQMNKLRHPYFNLEHEDIAGTLQILKNQISQHIEVNHDDFRPMLERAVYNNLKLLVDPKASFNSFFFAQKETLSLPVYQRFSQFFSDMDFIVNSILRYFQKNQIEEVEKESFFEKMDKVIEVYNRKSETGFDAYRAGLFQQISGRKLEEVLAEAAEEERIRQEQEQKAKEEEARKRREEEEAKRRAEEAARQEVEEARKQAEEAARLKAEEEARRIAEEARLKEEEERKKAEEEAKKLSFFDTISTSGDSFFDLDEEEDDSSAAIEVEESKAETAAEAEVEEAPIALAEVEAEEKITIEIEENETEVETTETEEEEHPPFVEVLEESVEEIIEETDSPVEEETSAPVAAVEEVVEEVAERTVEEVVAETAAVEVGEKVIESVSKEEEPVEAVAEVSPVEEPEAETLEEEFQEMAKNMEPQTETEEEAPKTILDKLGGKKESTSSYLDQFLNQKKSNGHIKEEPKEEVKPVEEKETNGGNTILDKITDKPKTIADSFQPKQQEQNPVGVNGNRKIKLDEIPIHKQYQYVQKVFDGNNVRFRIIVDKVNNAKNKAEVEDILNKFVLSNDSLDKGDGVVSEFIGLLRNRF